MKPDDFLNMIIFLSFVNGIITSIVVYYAITVYKVKRSYEAMLDHQSALQARQSHENQLLREKAGDMEVLITDIQSNMEKDNYSDLSTINNKIQSLENVVERHAKSWQLEQAFEKRILTSLGELQQWAKRMGDDPTLIRGY